VKLANIQILRACAALMIVVYHCGIETGRLAESSGGTRLFDETAWGSGVPLFFAISGFIMVVTSAKTFGSASGAFDFMRRRIFRIVPLYWMVTTVAVAVAVASPHLSNAPPGDHLYFVASYLFWPYMCLTGYVRPVATPGWTLNLEMMFYVVFAVGLMFRQRVGLLLLFASLGLMVLARVCGLLPGVVLNFWGDPIVLGFLFGAAIGIVFNNGVQLSGLSTIALAVVGFSALFFLPVPPGAEDDVGPRLASAIPSTLILIAFALGPQVNHKSNLWRPALLIGDASYSLYLVHAFLLRSLFFAWAKGPLGKLPLWTFIPIGIAMAVLAALTTYWWFEKPVTRWLNNKKTFRATFASGGSFAVALAQSARNRVSPRYDAT
jgi:exopolysaccharide production protein ExoZ